ncbi:MAG: tetraacyldisaccharide 4'-kinase [Planctomycetia bacterium]|nr:tetraacyldisaccharide 4'-kinase [Planctomycetia bacterium]
MKPELRLQLLEILNGNNKGVLAEVYRTLTLPVATPYAAVVSLRNRLYDWQILASHAAQRPVIAIGNLTLGGVGKSPLVAWIVDYLIKQKLSPAVVSRGYHAKRQANLYDQPLTSDAAEPSPGQDAFKEYKFMNDEAQEFALKFPQVPYFLGSDRVAVCNALTQSHPQVDVILLDDAYQHRRIRRNCNILVIDALNPFGGDLVFPSGFLREPLEGIRRADLIVLNRGDLVNNAARDAIRSKIKRFNPTAGWIVVAQQPVEIFQYVNPQDSSTPNVATPQSLPYHVWREQNVNLCAAAFCGLGAPRGFEKTLTAEQIRLAAFLPFPDHFAYDLATVEYLNDQAEKCRADYFLTTMKDFVKLKKLANKLSRPLFALKIGVEFLQGEKIFCQTILTSLQSAPSV